MDENKTQGPAGDSFRMPWKSKNEVNIVMESNDGFNPTIMISKERLPTVEIPSEYFEALVELSGYNPIYSHRLGYQKNFNNLSKYGLVKDESNSDGYYVLPGQNYLQAGTPYILWRESSGPIEDRVHHWVLSMDGLYFGAIATANWDDSEAVKALVSLMHNTNELYTQAVLLFPSYMKDIIAKVQHNNDFANWIDNDTLTHRLPLPPIRDIRRKGSVMKTDLNIISFQYEKAPDGLRLIVLYEDDT